MDAVEFVRNYKRMVKERGFGLVLVSDNNTPEEIVAEAEKWAKEHPVKTRQSVFLKLWPNAVTDNNGVIGIAPCRLGEVNSSKCNDAGRCPDCRKAFWSAEVEE